MTYTKIFSDPLGNSLDQKAVGDIMHELYGVGTIQSILEKL